MNEFIFKTEPAKQFLKSLKSFSLLISNTVIATLKIINIANMRIIKGVY